MSENFLITGATGFVGACVTQKLLQDGKKVSVIARNKNLNWRLQAFANQLTIYETDLLDPSLEELIKKMNPSVIFHFAAYGSLPNQNNIQDLIDVNVSGTVRLITALKKTSFKLFINAGSSSEYGVKETPMTESDVLEPVNDYGVTKVAAELFCREIAIKEQLPIITFRLFSPYGYFEDKNRLIPTVIRGALQNEVIRLSSPSYVRDFIFIDDLISAYDKAVAVTHKPGEVYNLGSGKQHSIKDVVAIILKNIHTSSTVQWGEVKKQSRQVEPVLWQADIAKIRKYLHWEPDYTIDSGLKKTIEWFKANDHLYEKN